MRFHQYTYPDPRNGGLPTNIPANVYVIGVALVIGLIIGTGAEFLKMLVGLIAGLVTEGTSAAHWNWRFLILPTVGILLAVLYQRYVVKQQIAHGTERIERLLMIDCPYMPVSQIWSPIFASSLTLGFGGSAGTEGPIATAGGAFGANMARWCGMPFPLVKAMLAIGAGAGIAGIFKAPVGGILFAIEVLGMGFTAVQILALTTACTASALAAYVISGMTTDVVYSSYIHLDMSVIPWAVILGVFCGLYSAYYRKLSRWTRGKLTAISNPWVKAVTAGLIVGVLITIFPRLYGEGYSYITEILNRNYDTIASDGPFAKFAVTPLLLILMSFGIIAVKSIAVACTTSGGGVAGDFAPAIFAGCMTGFFFTVTVNTLFGLELSVTDMVFLGMAAVLAGAVRAPLMSMFLVTEMVMHFTLLLPVAIACAMSYLVVVLFERGTKPVSGTSSGMFYNVIHDFEKEIHKFYHKNSMAVPESEGKAEKPVNSASDENTAK